MNLTDSKYNNFALVKEMLETSEVVANFDFAQVKPIADMVRKTGRIFLTGEGMFEFTKLTWKTEDMPYAETLTFNDSYDHATGDVIFYAQQAFQESLKNGTPFETPLSDGISALIYSLAAKKSSEEQITVKVPDWGVI